jgi:hypothetical protein
VTPFLAFLLGFSTRWAYTEVRRWWRARDTDRAAVAFFAADERVVSGIREMRR